MAALALSGCASTANRPCDRFGKIDDYRDHKDFIEQYGWALNTVKPINGQMLSAPGVPRVYIIEDGGESLRGYAWALYRDPDAWMHLIANNPGLGGLSPR